MNLCDQRASGVNYTQSLAFGKLVDLWWHAMGAENAHRSIRHFLKALDKNNVAFDEILDNMTIVDNLVIDVDGRWEQFEHALHNLYGPNHAGAESSRISQQDLSDWHKDSFIYLWRSRN
jgi:hypothetical protein